MGLEIWETVKKAIEAYTGLSTVTFFTAIALGLIIYHVVFGIFVSSNQHQQRGVNMRSFEDEMEPLPPPVEVGEITDDELKLYDGSDPKKPLLMAIKGQIYDVSQSRMFYGPGGAYALFAGKDASRALAKMSFEENDLTGDISGLGPFELEALQDWEYKFMSKYVKVGTLKKDVPVTDGSSSGEPSESGEATDRAIPTPAEGGSEEKPVDAGTETTSAEGADKKDE